MATITKDTRKVYVSTTHAELASLLGAKAMELGLIDFMPDRLGISDTGNGFELIFEKDTV